MEGTMVVPPDRGTIIGRALWKSRYVVVGPQKRTEQHPSSSSSSGRIGLSKEPSVRLDTIYLSVYKSKGDWEPVHQHHINSITDCQIQMVAHRKQGPVLPTLVITLSPDPATDKLRKRRSSRTAGLTSSKELPNNMLWFRSGDDNLSLQDWVQYIHMHMQSRAHQQQNQPMSPLSPNSPTFMNPFAPRHREPSEYSQRPPSGNMSTRGTITQHKPSMQPFLDSPSLRSKRSDISSHASIMHQSYGHYGQIRPTDLPSPAPTIQDYHGELIQGWTAAEGRSSTVNSPVRTRDSIGSQVLPPMLPTIDSSSPPGPRETILDRAFQLRRIPGSENEIPGEEKLSSIARFEALMREADKKRATREAEERKNRPVVDPLKTAWEEDGDDSDTDDMNDEDDGRSTTTGSSRRGYPRVQRNTSQKSSIRSRRYNKGREHAHEADLEEEDVIMPVTAQRALDFITGRQSPTFPGAAGGLGGAPREHRMAPSSRTGEYSPDGLGPMNSGFSHHHHHQHQHNLRPETVPAPRRNTSAVAQQRNYSQDQLVAAEAAVAHINSGRQAARSMSVTSGGTEAVFPLPPSYTASSSLGGLVRRSTTASVASTAATSVLTTTEKRLSTSSAKRLSFTEQLTKRLSSTSSLLLVQTNASTASSRGSSTEFDPHLHPNSQQSLQYHRHPPPEHCGWRGGVGVIGAEGGFL